MASGRHTVGVLGIVLATDDGLLHVLPGAAPDHALRGVRFAALDYREGVAIAAAPGRGAWMHRGHEWEQVWEGEARVVRIAADGACYVGEQQPRLHCSRDGGETWAELENVPSIVRAHSARRPGSSRAEVAIVGIAFPQNQLLLGLRPIGTWLSRDGGYSWMRGDQIELSARSEPLQAADLGEHLNGIWEHPELSDRLYAASRRGFFRSDDGGFTWQRAQAGLDRLFVNGVAVLPGKPDTLLLSAASSGLEIGEAPAAADAALFRSPNGGQAWQRVELGEEHVWPRPPLVAAVSGGTDVLFAHAGAQLWASHDRGARWLPIADALPPANAIVAAL
jgi:hypothetical protein